MNEKFITFQKFDEQVSALDLGKILDENNIEYLLEDTSLSFDPTFSNNGFGKEFRIKIQKQDFEKVDILLQKSSQTEINEIDKDHYLFSFSDDELIELITKRDEWSQFDFLLAQKILKERGREISPEMIEQIKKERIIALSKPEESQKNWIIVGYISALLGGLLGVFIGWHLLTHKKTLPDGSRIYAYSEMDRTQGNRILILGGIFVFFWLTIRILI